MTENNKLIHDMANKPIKQPFRILSLDGGGICGAFVAGFLAGVEERTGMRVGEYFDLISGTSTGGIIAAALAFREPASKLESFYLEHGPKIFTRRRVRLARLRAKVVKKCIAPLVDWAFLKRVGLDSNWLLRSKYEGNTLRAALTEVFGDKVLGESPTRLVIPSINLTCGQTKVFKTPHLPGLHIDLRFPVVDVVMATTAAPTYFPHAVVERGSMYVDGGLWANNPTMVGIVESMAIANRCEREEDPRFDLDTTSVLSVGTGKCKKFLKPTADGAGLAWWMAGGKLISTTMMTQSQAALFQASYLLQDRLCRIDFDIPDDSWNIDSVQYLEEMVHIGRKKAAETVESLRMRFLGRPAKPYVPFEQLPERGLSTRES